MESEKDVFDIIIEENEKRNLLTLVRNRINKVSKLFLYTGIFGPIYLVGMLIMLYFFGDLNEDKFLLVLIVFSVMIFLQIILSLLMYKKYNKMSKLEDQKLVETSFYKVIKNAFYTNTYHYKGHIILINSTYEKTYLVIDNQEQDIYKGIKNKNFKLHGKIGEDKIKVIYKNGYSNGSFIVYCNNVKLEEVVNS